ncbi:MAG: hypothetical protein Q7S85_00565 [Rugosibacter sp.]|nr:hypothetical protein [Rugosibacter sp.]
MNRAQRLVVVLALPALVFIPFYWHTGCLLGNWRCEETRPFLMTLAGLAVMIVSGLVLRFDFDRLRRRLAGLWFAIVLPIAAGFIMAAFLDLHGGNDLFDDRRLPFWWIVILIVAAFELWLLSGDGGRVIDGEFRELSGTSVTRGKH